MFNFFKNFNKKQDIKEELPKVVSDEKGRSLKSVNPFYHTSEHQEEDERINENDLKGHLRKYVPVNEISSGDEWESYGEGSDEVEEKLEEEEIEELKEVFDETLPAEELKQRIWALYIKNEELDNKHKELSENPKKDADIEHKEVKINRKEERKTRTNMSPIKTVSSRDDVRFGNKPRSHPRNKKTVSDSQKQKMHREKIAEFLDSKEGQNRIM